ncbi:hypothetical protein N7444_009929 [Penicillium canescens]|nr:hypothetical protein N7444_009929 [Penicillium canescens]
MKPTDKHFRCNICQRGFTRIDHLKRHHLRHSGQKPYTCIFCNDSPCGSCQKRNLACNNERTAGPSLPEIEEDTTVAPMGLQQGTFPIHAGPPVKPQIYEAPSSDRGSIKFLLNGGTDSFTENFRLPPRSDRARSLNYHHRVDMEEAQRTGFPYIENERPEYASGFVNADPAIPLSFPDIFLDFLNVPFADGVKPTHESYSADGINYEGVVPPQATSGLALQGDQPLFEPERPFATALIQAILARAWQAPLDAKAQAEVTANLNFFLTTARIRKCIFLYFKYWQPSCAYVHSSFDPETAPLPLLAGVVFMGAMYNSDERESYIAKRVLDFVELFIFSSDVFSAECEVSTIFSGNRCHDGETNDWTKFQNLLAGVIILTVQYWAGNRVARYRALETRFTEIVKVARRMELTKTRHDPVDQVAEHLWIQKECRIRTICIIALLDSAFFFYQNYPCRITHTEMECDLPCHEPLFRSEHPFTAPDFRFSRELTLLSAFQSLFQGTTYGTSHQNMSPQETSQDQSRLHQSSFPDLSVFDMFLLIHMLFSFINTHMTLLGPFIRMGHVKKSMQDTTLSPHDNSPIPEDSILTAIRAALSRWHEHWVVLTNRVSPEEWALMGFYKNAYNFWLVSQMLITKKDAVDVVMQMEVNCEDKLEKLKVLLRDDQDEV